MQFTLSDKKTLVPGVESFVFKSEEPLLWKPGQYAHYILPHSPADNRGTERWFTISSAPFEENITITTRLAIDKSSTFKSALNNLKIGQLIQSDYIEGDFVVENLDQEYVFIAGGIGITPFHSILKEADHTGIKIHATLLYANRDANFIFKDELDIWAKNNPNLTIHYLTSPTRVDESAITKYVADIQKPLFYLSGPEPMVKNFESMLQTLGVPANHLKLDDFPGYPAE